MSELLQIWNSTQLDGGTPPPPYYIPNSVNSQSLKFNNQSRYWLTISKNGVAVDLIEPFSYLITPFQSDIALTVDPTYGTSTLVANVEFVNYSTMDGAVAYEKGSVQFNGTPSVQVESGTVNLSNDSNLSVAIEGTPTVQLSPDSTVQLSGTSTVNIGNTPEVQLASGTEIAIAGTPTFNLAQGVSVGIDVNANTVQFGEQNGVTVQNESIGTDIGYGMTRDIGGGVFYAQNTGITACPFAELVQQVYIQNRGSADIYVTGDEDPTMQSQGLLLSTGDAIGLSWRTKNLYLKSAAAQIPVQVQGFY